LPRQVGLADLRRAEQADDRRVGQRRAHGAKRRTIKGTGIGVHDANTASSICLFLMALDSGVERFWRFSGTKPAGYGIERGEQDRQQARGCGFDDIGADGLFAAHRLFGVCRAGLHV
jgi:hypothetical protein